MEGFVEHAWCLLKQKTVQVRPAIYQKNKLPSLFNIKFSKSLPEQVYFYQTWSGV